MQPVRLSQDDSKRSALLRGFGMLEAVISLMVCISLMSLGAKYIGQQADQILNQVTATQLSQVASAAHHYAHDHFEALQRATSSGTPVEWGSLEIEQLLCDNGYLPKTIHDHNPYQQRYRIVIQQPQPQLLQLLLLTQGGQIISEAGLRQIAQKAGPSSGYISHLNPKQATGSQAGWQLPLSGDLATPPGHLAAVNYINANDVLSASSLLFRQKIAGHKEYNRMEADLHMAANIELEDGTKIWFNQGSNRSTVIEGGKIALTSEKASITLQPEKLTVNTTYGVSGVGGIETNSHMKAAGDVVAGRHLNAGRDIKASGNITSLGDITATRNLFAKKLKIGNMELTSDSLKFNGVDIRRDADIPEYHTHSMYERGYLWQTALNHCRNHWSRLFVVNDGGWARHLVMCLNSASSKGSDYWVVATGDYRHPQSLNRRVP